LCIVGSTTIVIHAPKEEEIENVGVLVEKIQEPGKYRLQLAELQFNIIK
jgi:hypothetical protein